LYRSPNPIPACPTITATARFEPFSTDAQRAAAATALRAAGALLPAAVRASSRAHISLSQGAAAQCRVAGLPSASAPLVSHHAAPASALYATTVATPRPPPLDSVAPTPLRLRRMEIGVRPAAPLHP
jgi:hypothetical protein